MLAPVEGAAISGPAVYTLVSVMVSLGVAGNQPVKVLILTLVIKRE